MTWFKSPEIVRKTTWVQGLKPYKKITFLVVLIWWFMSFRFPGNTTTSLASVICCSSVGHSSTALSMSELTRLHRLEVCPAAGPEPRHIAAVIAEGVGVLGETGGSQFAISSAAGRCCVIQTNHKDETKNQMCPLYSCHG